MVVFVVLQLKRPPRDPSSPLVRRLNRVNSEVLRPAVDCVGVWQDQPLSRYPVPREPTGRTDVQLSVYFLKSTVTTINVSRRKVCVPTPDTLILVPNYLCNTALSRDKSRISRGTCQLRTINVINRKIFQWYLWFNRLWLGNEGLLHVPIHNRSNTSVNQLTSYLV